MELVFAFIAGVLTLINPCILPVLPIAIVSSLNSHRLGPVALVAGLSLVFTVVGVLVASVGPSIGLHQEQLAQIGAVMMMLFGVLMLVPNASARFSHAFAGVSDAANERMNALPTTGLGGQFLGGSLLGLVWSPCIGPTLGGAIALAAGGGSLVQAGITMFVFSLGVASVILVLAYGARGLFNRHRASLQSLASRSGLIIGSTFIAIGLLLFFKVHHAIEGFLLDHMPVWLMDLSVSV